MKIMSLRDWNDTYTLGVFAAKTNTIDYCLKKKAKLKSRGRELALFNLGVSDADKVSFKEIGFDIKCLIKFCGENLVYEFLSRYVSQNVVNQIKQAVSESTDWETEEQRSASHDILDEFIRHRLVR